ncbi:MAG: peptidylprolyl isomerase [Deltaproteobacteria bacterium]|nr:peptidylprolyl isomerase [Candidatus Zymogenaceae bacterium]
MKAFAVKTKTPDVRTIIAYTIGTLFLLTAVIAPIQSSAVEISDRVIALVNDEVITMSDLFEEGGDDVTGDPDRVLKNGMTVAEAREIILQQLIAKALLNDAVRAYGIEVTRDDVDDAIEQQMEVNGLTKAQLMEILAENDMTYAEYEKEVEYTIKKERLIAKKLGSHIIITDEDVNTYFNEHKDEYQDLAEFRISEIIMGVSPDADATTINALVSEVEKVRKRAMAGEDFAALAKEYSISPSAEEGGDLGWLNPGEMEPGLLAFLSTMKVGEVSEVLTVQNTLLILKLTDKRPIPGGVTVDDVRDEIEYVLTNERTMYFFEKWIEDLKEEAYITIML